MTYEELYQSMTYQDLYQQCRLKLGYILTPRRREEWLENCGDYELEQKLMVMFPKTMARQILKVCTAYRGEFSHSYAPLAIVPDELVAKFEKLFKAAGYSLHV